MVLKGQNLARTIQVLSLLTGLYNSDVLENVSGVWEEHCLLYQILVMAAGSSFNKLTYEVLLVGT
jgi:hypothetical protein